MRPCAQPRFATRVCQKGAMIAPLRFSKGTSPAGGRDAQVFAARVESTVLCTRARRLVRRASRPWNHDVPQAEPEMGWQAVWLWLPWKPPTGRIKAPTFLLKCAKHRQIRERSRSSVPAVFGAAVNLLPIHCVVRARAIFPPPPQDPSAIRAQGELCRCTRRPTDEIRGQSVFSNKLRAGWKPKCSGVRRPGRTEPGWFTREMCGSLSGCRSHGSRQPA